MLVDRGGFEGSEERGNTRGKGKGTERGSGSCEDSEDSEEKTVDYEVRVEKITNNFFKEWDKMNNNKTQLY